MAGPGDQRKLTTIVALDAAGFSARTLADEDSAVAEIASLRLRIAAACARHGGRVFNSAGDGFMLEFPTVSGALFAAEDLAESAEIPVRIGVHLGEVTVTPTGDLLGHGVNVAARIQALASPGSVLVSNDIRRAVRGAFAGRFIPHGSVRLDKMDETIKVFGLTRASAASRVRLAWRSLKAPLLATAAIALVAVGAVWLWRSYSAALVASQARVAILPFQVQADDALTKTAAHGMADEMATVLNGAQFVTIAADKSADLRGADRRAALGRLGAAFLLDGSVTHQGPVLKAHVRLDDTRAGVTVWSETLSVPDSDPAALETAVASRATTIAILARKARRSPGGDVGPGVLEAFLKADDAIDSVGRGGSVQARGVLQQIVAQAPKFSRGRSSLAIADALISRWAPPDEQRSLARAAREQAAEAMVLDPHSGEPYLALYLLVPWRSWVERERAMLRGMAVEPEYQRAVSTRSNFLADVGRLGEAVDVGQRALAANPLDPHTNERYADELAEAGQFGAAKAAAEQMVRVRPADWTDLSRLSLVMLYGSAEDSRTMLGRSRAHPYPGQTAALDVWALFLRARETHAAGDRARAVQAIKDAVEQGAWLTRDAVPALCLLGDLDAAFAYFPRFGTTLADSHIDFLWQPAAAPLLRDPRFWDFAAQLGMVRYWRTTGHWPDACLGPTASVDCQALAAAAGMIGKGGSR